MDGTHLLTPYTVWYGELELHGKQNLFYLFLSCFTRLLANFLKNWSKLAKIWETKAKIQNLTNNNLVPRAYCLFYWGRG